MTKFVKFLRGFETALVRNPNLKLYLLICWLEKTCLRHQSLLHQFFFNFQNTSNMGDVVQSDFPLKMTFGFSPLGNKQKIAFGE